MRALKNRQLAHRTKPNRKLMNKYECTVDQEL